MHHTAFLNRVAEEFAGGAEERYRSAAYLMQ